MTRTSPNSTMPYHSRPISETEIDSLPLRFVKLEQGEQETFTDVLLQVWFALAQSGSLATLPPVPDIVSFVDDCSFFYLIFHTHPDELKLAPGDRLTSSPSPPPTASSSKTPPRTSPNKRPHPYAHARPQPLSSNDRSLSDEVIGCVYLSYSSSTQSTLDMGIALRPEARGKGFGRAAITKFLRFSFDTLGVHRVVANVFGPSDLNQQQSARESGAVRWIFEKLGFVPEGVQRRAAFSAAEGIWRDVYPLAMLDVDWVRLGGRRPEGRAGITCPFEAMIERHTAEQEEMSEWMEDPGWGQLRRVASTETIKGPDDEEPPIQKPEPRSPSSTSSFTIPSEHDWRSATPSTDADYSLVSHSPPPDYSPAPSDLYSPFATPSDLYSPSAPPSDIYSPSASPSDLYSPVGTPAPFSMIGSPDLDPPLSPGFSITDEEIIELALLSTRVTPYVVGSLPTTPPSVVPTTLPSVPTTPPSVVSSTSPSVFSLQDGDEPLEYWPSDSDFDGSERGR
ncbi:GNAT family acetyltransferase [Rhizoctonia solani AG-3 Rhs1AP]|uniref:GNAT family acetyltransferase n=1 Tax=Rhizoctonia solani AG-3 Rhs1AP TaxID=1086054 RepID=X8IZ71_9AGAM|nr:GNAT family acetyltransferase [Rhizoctonia solani AG-3 Rhs1AP]